MKNYQHQPLRKPNGWTGQDASLIVQLERLLDDIYKKLGKLKEKLALKADKVTEATSGDFTVLDSDGNLSDSGYSPSSMLGGIAIIVSGDKASQNVSKGNYVAIIGSTITGITDGLYTANANVSSGVSFASSDLTAVSNGGLNSLKDSMFRFKSSTGITTLNDTSLLGVYLLSATNVSNLPSNDWYEVVAMQSFQIAAKHNDQGIYYRTYANNQWYQWRTFEPGNT